MIFWIYFVGGFIFGICLALFIKVNVKSEYRYLNKFDTNFTCNMSPIMVIMWPAFLFSYLVIFLWVKCFDPIIDKIAQKYIDL